MLNKYQECLTEMLTAFGGQWPPRAQFTNWPIEFVLYMDIADAIPHKLSNSSSPQVFRMWMKEVLEKVNEPSVEKALDSRLSDDRVDGVLLGFLSCLSFLIQSYRWATLPVTQEERERKSLHIPEQLWNPFVKLCDFLGLIHRGNAFSLITCNAVYEDPPHSRETPENASSLCDEAKMSWRFKFNSDERVWKTEEIFYRSFLEMERAFTQNLHTISDYLTQTDLAQSSADPFSRSVTFDRRLKLLTELKIGMKTISKMFHYYVTKANMEPHLWAEYVQSMIGWNINGTESGASGAESILFHVLDEFLHIPGECVMYHSALDKRKGIPHYCRSLIDELKEGREYRFDKLNDSEEGCSNPLMKCRDEIIQCLGMWRLSHAKISGKYLQHSQMTASGTVDKIYDKEEETLATRSERELRERARETLKCIHDRNRRRKSLQHSNSPLHPMSLNKETNGMSYFQSALEYVKNIFTSSA